MPEETRPEAELSTGRLLVRARAAQLAEAGAPPAVYDAQRHRHQLAEAARREAALARAAGDEQTAAERDAAATEHTDAAARLDDVAETRAEYRAVHAETLAVGRAAHEELTRRGETPDARPEQLVTAEEFIAAEQRARAEDDAWRPITEADLDPAHEAGEARSEKEPWWWARTPDPTATTPAAEPAASLSAEASAAEVAAAVHRAHTARERLTETRALDTGGQDAHHDWHHDQRTRDVTRGRGRDADTGHGLEDERGAA
jgi:hypothetical protein